MNEQNSANERITDVEERLTRVENLLVSINEKLDQRSNIGEVDTAEAEEFKQWVTNYVSMRLQQLVPETCDHPDGGCTPRRSLPRQHHCALYRGSRTQS